MRKHMLKTPSSSISLILDLFTFGTIRRFLFSLFFLFRSLSEGRSHLILFPLITATHTADMHFDLLPDICRLLVLPQPFFHLLLMSLCNLQRLLHLSSQLVDLLFQQLLCCLFPLLCLLLLLLFPCTELINGGFWCSSGPHLFQLFHPPASRGQLPNLLVAITQKQHVIGSASNTARLFQVDQHPWHTLGHETRQTSKRLHSQTGTHDDDEVGLGRQPTIHKERVRQL